MDKLQNEIEPGTVAQRLIGTPGPERDLALVTECLGHGRHRVKSKVWGQGEWYGEETTARLMLHPGG